MAKNGKVLASYTIQFSITQENWDAATDEHLSKLTDSIDTALDTVDVEGTLTRMLKQVTNNPAQPIKVDVF